MSARRVCSSLALASLLAACAKPADQTAAAPAAIDSAAVKAAVTDLWARWSAADTAGNVEALAGMVADSARLDIRGLPPLFGRAAFRAAAAAAVKVQDVTAMTITPEMTTAISDGLAYETGNYTNAFTENRKNMMEYGRYATAVGKDADGQWRIFYIMVFADSSITKK